MSDEKTRVTEKVVLGRLRNAEAVYVPISDCTKLPFVSCHPETYDDQAYVFFREEDAKRECARIAAQGNPMHLIRMERKFLLSFYASLLPMGVNCLVIDGGTKEEVQVQLSSLISRKHNGTDAQGRPIVENPELVLTALYLLQQLRAGNAGKPAEDTGELQEELMAHYGRGRYIVAVQEGKGVPVIRQKDGKVFQPIFTDIQEFLKFQNSQKDTKFKTAVIEAEKIGEIMAKEAFGIVVNPFSLNLHPQVRKNVQPGEENQ